MSVSLSILNNRNTVTTTRGNHKSTSFQDKLAQQHFQKTCWDSLLLPFSCHCVCLSFLLKKSAMTACVHVCWQKGLGARFWFPWVNELCQCLAWGQDFVSSLLFFFLFNSRNFHHLYPCLQNSRWKSRVFGKLENHGNDSFSKSKIK